MHPLTAHSWKLYNTQAIHGTLSHSKEVMQQFKLVYLWQN